MDQIPSVDNDKVPDESGLLDNSPVNPSEDNVIDSNLVDQGTASSNSNEEISPETPSNGPLEIESPTCENDVSSTNCVENEFISNEDDPMVGKYSTCEGVEDFSNVDDSSSKKVDPERSSEQPNVDISVDDNVSNPVEELPSAPDHIELPSTSDHIQLSSASEHIEQPSTCDNVEPPSVSDQIKQPSPSDHIELPLVSNHIDIPSFFDHTEQPSGSDAMELPVVSHDSELSSPHDATPVPSSPRHTNAADSPISEVATNVESYSNTEASPITDGVGNAEVSPHTDVTHDEASHNTEIYNAEASLNTEVVPDAEASIDPEVITNAEANPQTNIAESSLDTKVVTNAEDSPSSQVVTNTAPSTNSAVVTPAEGCSSAEVSINADSTSNAELSLDTKVVTSVEDCPNNDVVDDTVSITAEAVTNAEVSSNAEDIINPDSSHQLNEDADDVPKIPNVCDSPGKEINPVNIETHRNNFLPTIVAIRGGCTDVLEKTNSVPEPVSSSTSLETSGLNIVSVLGGCKDVDLESDISKTNVGSSSPNKSDHIVHSISDSEETAVSNECPDNPIGSDITIKQEPHDDDCVHSEIEHGTTPVTSEFPVKEDGTSNIKVEDPEVICIETTSEIPSPIPIKMESNIDCSNVEAESQSSNTTGKFTAKKRLTRSSVSQSDDCIILSSSSDVDSVSDSKKRNRSTITYSTAGYTCHLCNTVFQEHELLNEHMILHRNNSLIEAKVQNRSKTTKTKVYSCNICQKQLSTSQSLQQHVLIHKNEKPFVCSICEKDFRHLQNYRIHLQKHKEEQRRHGKTQQQGIKEQLDRSVVRGVDFGRLVGPLFMKENLWHQEKDPSSSKNQHSDVASSSETNKKTAFRFTTKESVSHQPRLSFDQPPFKTNVNSSSSPVIIKRREPSPDSSSEEECVAVKSFSNIESVVMNAAKIIVKLDNLDTSVLKRKLQTPDISIDQPPKKCRVMLSPIAEKCNIKLDEIENIPMDIDAGEIDLPAAEQMHDNGDSCVNKGNKDPVNSPACTSRGTLTENELFNLLNDDTTPADSGDCGSKSQNQILKPDHHEVDNSTSDSVKTVASPLHKRSNVIFMEAPASYEMCSYEDEDNLDSRLDDAFDTAFQKVATRRLALLRKRATENGGKIESRYLLGPLFWRKALRRAQKQAGHSTAVTNVDITFSGSKNGSRGAALRTRPSPFGGRSRFDNRRTNDPTKLQVRAECKFKYLLELAKMLSDLNSLNLAGPLFWRRTLQLAGVHRGEDLRMHVDMTSPTLDGIEFVDDGGRVCNFNDVLVNTEKTSPSQLSDSVQQSPSDQFQPSVSNSVQPSPANRVQSSNSSQLSPFHRVQPSSSEVPAVCTVSNDRLATGGLSFTSKRVAGNVSKLAGEMQTSAAHSEPRKKDAAVQNTSLEVTSLKTDSILYESLTKPKEKPQQSTGSEGISTSYVDPSSLFVANRGSAVESSLAGHLKADVENCSNDQSTHQSRELTGDVAVDEGIAKVTAIDSGSIVLNVDSSGALQLIPTGDQIPMAGAGQNFVLVSDGSGAMQYMVNVPGDNFGNFELIGNGAGADQVAYAIQFDGENYAAVQFVQDAGMPLQSDAGLKETQMLVDPKAATFLVSDAGATAAAVADPNHIGKELSDFLNLDYGNLLKNGTADQPIS